MEYETILTPRRSPVTSLGRTCAPEEKFTLTIIEPNPTDGRMTILSQEKDDVTDIGFRAVHRFTAPNGSMMSVVIPGIYDENECHKLAIKINAPKHACFEYRIAVSHADVADAVQDELQDQGVIR